jgi:hypothetical protein
MMNDEPEEPQVDADSEIEREIRQGRKISAKDVMSRLAGPGAMKGASPVSPVQQAETEIGNWLSGNLDDDCGALRAVVHRQLKGSEPLLNNLDQPLTALAAYCRRIVASRNLLSEIVREADVEWGRSMDERPYFERDAAAPDPDDPYTIEGVRQALDDALQKLPSTQG